MAQAAATSADPNTASYAPRRSNRVSSDIAADGDMWQERLAVCEGFHSDGTPRLLIRSYYRNDRTKERVWDEPPSGASRIEHATNDMRQMAEAQLKDLQLTLDMIPPEEEDDRAAASQKKKKKKGFLNRFRKKEKATGVDTSRDINLQRAIARSMADAAGKASDEPVVYYDPEANEQPLLQVEDDEDMALAKALSESIALSQHAQQPQQGLSEEEMFQKAVEASRKESIKAATGVARKPDRPDVSESSFSTSSPQPYVVGKSDPNERSLDQFDPYAGGGHGRRESQDPPPPTVNVPAPQGDDGSGRGKSARSRASRRVFGGRKNMENEAGLV